LGTRAILGPVSTYILVDPQASEADDRRPSVPEAPPLHTREVGGSKPPAPILRCRREILAGNVAGDVEIIRRAFEALNGGGTEAFLDHVHPEFEATTPPHLGAEPGTFRGHDGVRRYFDSFSESMDDVRLAGDTFHDVADRVVVEMTLKARGKTTGIEVGQPLAQVWEVRDGKAFRLENFATLDQALEAAGLTD
jgi:uncharacterized protein